MSISIAVLVVVIILCHAPFHPAAGILTRPSGSSSYAHDVIWKRRIMFCAKRDTRLLLQPGEMRWVYRTKLPTNATIEMWVSASTRPCHWTVVLHWFWARILASDASDPSSVKTKASGISDWTHNLMDLKRRSGATMSSSFAAAAVRCRCPRLPRSYCI